MGEEVEVGGKTMSAGELDCDDISPTWILVLNRFLFAHVAHYAVSATIPWQEGKEEDFAELREGLR